MSSPIRLLVERNYSGVARQARRFPRPIVCGNIGIERRGAARIYAASA
jgi:hypothetical protein